MYINIQKDITKYKFVWQLVNQVIIIPIDKLDYILKFVMKEGCPHNLGYRTCMD